jgi:hypothetical protein
MVEIFLMARSFQNAETEGEVLGLSVIILPAHIFQFPRKNY